MREALRSLILPLFAGALLLAGCGGDGGSDDEQSAGATDTVADTTDAIDGTAAPVGEEPAPPVTVTTTSSVSVLSVSTTSTTTSSTTPTTAASTPCSGSSIAGDLGAASQVVDGACESGWAVVDVCDDEPCGDSWVLARHQGGRWSIVTGFPSALCRNHVSVQGAPDRVLDVVHWPPCRNATTTATTPTTSGTVDLYSILDVFIAAWNAGDWATMSTVAEPSVVETARAAAIPGGSVLPGPARGRCFFGAPNTTCEVAYGSQGAGTLFTLTVTDRIVAMA